MQAEAETVTYTLDDCGCYVDGVRGIYATDAIVDFARLHGATIEHEADCEHAETCDASEFAGCEVSGEYEDDADAYMEAHYGVDGAYWGRNENSDWGLWTIEED